MNYWIRTRCIRAVASVLVVASIGASYAHQDKKPTLYERLGGVHAIAAFSEDLAGRLLMNEVITDNPEVVKRLPSAAKPAIIFQLTAFLGQATGGPQKYIGRDMVTAHRGMNITDREWDAFVQDAIASMNKFKIPADLQQELAKMVLSLKDQIVDNGKRMESDSVPMMPTPLVKKDSLYARLGGLPAIAAVVDEFVNRLASNKTVMNNPNVVKSLTSGKVSAAGIKYLVVEQLSQAAGGPHKYSGKDMKTSHKGLMITDEEWNAAGKDLMDTFAKFKVPKREQDEILTILGSLKKDIVGQ